MKATFITFIATGLLLILSISELQAQTVYNTDTDIVTQNHGERAFDWALPTSPDRSSGFADYPDSDIEFITQMGVRFGLQNQLPTGPQFDLLMLYIDGLGGDIVETEVNYAGPEAMFAWPIPFNHVPQTFLKHATRFTAPETSNLTSVSIFAGANTGSSDGLNDTLKVSILRPFEPTSQTIKYGNENPDNNPTWEFNFPVGTSRSAYGTRFTIPAASRVNTVQFWVQNMNHNTFLPPGDDVPDDTLVIRLWSVDADTLPSSMLAETRVSLLNIEKQAWNEVSFFEANVTTEMQTEMAVTFELEAVGLQDHVALSSGAQQLPPKRRSIVKENGNWITIASSQAFSGGNARGAELWVRAKVLPVSETINDDRTPDESRPLAEAIRIPMSQITPNGWNEIDLSAAGIQVNSGQDFWVSAELITVGDPDTFVFISHAAEPTPRFRSAVFLEDGSGVQRWRYMQNTQFENEFIMRMTATFAVEGAADPVDDLFIVLYDDNDGLPGNFLRFIEVSLADMEAGAFNSIDISSFAGAFTTEQPYHIVVTSSYDNDSFTLSTDDGEFEGDEPDSYTIVYLSKSDAWSRISDIEGLDSYNLLMYQVYRSSPNSIDGQEDLLPATHRLTGNYPNPFNPTTTIRFELAESDVVRITVHDVLGREVVVLTDGARSAGQHAVQFDGSTLGSGTYIIHMQAGAQRYTSKMMLIK